MAATLPDLLQACSSSSTDPASHQGALQNKGSCTRALLEQAAKSLTDGRHDPRKISLVLDHIFSIYRGVAVPTTGRTEATPPGLQLARVAEVPLFRSLV